MLACTTHQATDLDNNALSDADVLALVLRLGDAFRGQLLLLLLPTLPQLLKLLLLTCNTK
jgi:hypothetical protein